MVVALLCGCRYDPTKDARLKGLLSIRVENGKWLVSSDSCCNAADSPAQSPVQKHLEPSAQHELSQLMQPDDGDLLVIAAGTAANHKWVIACALAMLSSAAGWVDCGMN